MEIVAFTLLNGADITGERVESTDLGADFIKRDDVIYLKNAVILGIQQDPNGGDEHRVMFGPVAMYAEREHPQKSYLPYALYTSTIVGQYTLSDQLKKLYKEYTSGLILPR